MDDANKIGDLNVVPSNVSALPVVRAELLLAYRTPLAVKLVRPVPPFVVARVPERVIVPDPVIGPPEVVSPVVPPDTLTEVTVPPDPVAERVPPAKETPDPIVTLLNPPDPLPYRMLVPLVAGA